jgi:hypothetical protein
LCGCRFANPASLNGATSWVFLNSPENIQHVCATNVKNYTMRYLPVRVENLQQHQGSASQNEHQQQQHCMPYGGFGATPCFICRFMVCLVTPAAAATRAAAAAAALHAILWHCHLYDRMSGKL